MRWIDVGGEAHGIIAIGQFATGVIAIGQVAWGVVAIGQIAVGWLAVGQVAVGGVTVGMAGVGLHATAAMVGIGGRGIGTVLPLLPSLGRRLVPKGIVPLETVRSSAAAEGWVRLHLVPQAEARIALFDGSTRVRDVRLDARVRKAAVSAAPGDVWAHLRRSGDGWIADRLIGVPRPRFTEPRWWLVWGVQLMGLLLLSAALWWAAGEVLLDAWFGPSGIFR